MVLNKYYVDAGGLEGKSFKLLRDAKTYASKLEKGTYKVLGIRIYDRDKKKEIYHSKNKKPFTRNLNI